MNTTEWIGGNVKNSSVVSGCATAEEVANMLVGKRMQFNHYRMGLFTGFDIKQATVVESPSNGLGISVVGDSKSWGCHGTMDEWRHYLDGDILTIKDGDEVISQVWLGDSPTN